MTDDPGVSGSGNATQIVIGAASLSATKSVSGSTTVGGNVTYTIVISNSGSIASNDNAGNEFTDVLPAQLALVSATANSGTAVANTGTNTVTWNGSVPASGSVTITITATILPSAAGQSVSNQGNVSYDADNNGTNETTVPTDDPSTGTAGDPTTFAAGRSNRRHPDPLDLALLLMAFSIAIVAAVKRLT